MDITYISNGTNCGKYTHDPQIGVGLGLSAKTDEKATAGSQNPTAAGNVVLIIDPDVSATSSPLHLLNASRTFEAVQRYNPKGVCVIAPNAGSIFKGDNVLFAKEPSQENLFQAVNAIKGVLRPDDRLLIFVTGHGDFDKKTKEAALVFPGGEDVTESEFAGMLAMLPAVNRSIFMDQCFGGEWLNTLSSPTTFFVANSGTEEATFCEPWVRRLNSASVPDLNKDGIISNAERVAYAGGANQPFGVSTSVGDRYVDYGYGNVAAAPLYKPKVVSVNNKSDLEKWQRLNPYGVIVLKFGANSFCKPCREFDPLYEELARNSSGDVLFLNKELDNDLEDNDLSRDFGQKPLPSVFVIKGNTRAEVDTKTRIGLQARLALQIKQMKEGTHPALLVASEDSKAIAEDQSKPIALRIRALKVETDKKGSNELWAQGFLKDPAWQIRRAALDILMKRPLDREGIIESFEALKKAKSDPDLLPMVAKTILQEKGIIGRQDQGDPDPQVVESLLKEAETAPSLSEVVGGAVKFLLPLLNDRAIEVRVLAAKSLLQLENSPGGIKLENFSDGIKAFIGKAINHPDPSIRLEAAEVIAVMADPSFFPYIIKLSKERDPLILEIVVRWCISRWQLKEFIPALERILSSTPSDSLTHLNAEHDLKQLRTAPRKVRSVAKSKIPVDQFNKVWGLFIDPSSEILIFKPSIGKEDIGRIDIPTELKGVLQQALLGNKDLQELRREFPKADPSFRPPLAAQIWMLEQKGRKGTGN